MNVQTARPPVATQVLNNEFIPPEVMEGDIVTWYPYGEESKQSEPAIVTQIGSRTIGLHIFVENSRTPVYKDGVRHISDPDAKRAEFIESGAWDHNRRTKELLELKQAVLELTTTPYAAPAS